MGWLALRSLRQRRDIRRAVAVLALSEEFGSHLVEDYGVEIGRIRLAPNPIDLAAFQPALATVGLSGRPLTYSSP